MAAPPLLASLAGRLEAAGGGAGSDTVASQRRSQLSADPLGSGERMATPFHSVEQHLRVLAAGRTPWTPPARLLDRLLRRKRVPIFSPLINPPASAADLAGFEQRYEVALPDDVVACYRHMNGSEEYTDVTASWLRFWPIGEWKPVAEEFPDDPFSSQEPLAGSFVFADHGIWAWFFALDLDPLRLGRVYSLVSHGSVFVASSFTEFVELALSGSDRLFPA